MSANARGPQLRVTSYRTLHDYRFANERLGKCREMAQPLAPGNCTTQLHTIPIQIKNQKVDVFPTQRHTNPLIKVMSGRESDPRPGVGTRGGFQNKSNNHLPRLVGGIVTHSLIHPTHHAHFFQFKVLTIHHNTLTIQHSAFNIQFEVFHT